MSSGNSQPTPIKAIPSKTNQTVGRRFLGPSQSGSKLPTDKYPISPFRRRRTANLSLDLPSHRPSPLSISAEPLPDFALPTKSASAKRPSSAVTSKPSSQGLSGPKSTPEGFFSKIFRSKKNNNKKSGFDGYSDQQSTFFDEFGAFLSGHKSSAPTPNVLLSGHYSDRYIPFASDHVYDDSGDKSVKPAVLRKHFPNRTIDSSSRRPMSEYS